MYIKILAIMVMALTILACQNTDNVIKDFSKNNKKIATEKSIDINNIIQNKQIIFNNKQIGNYPDFIDDEYKMVNNEIHQLIEQLIEFDNASKDDNKLWFYGVTDLDYKILHLNQDSLSLAINYAVQDMTARYFTKYYQVDLKNKKQVRLNEYLKNHSIDIDKLHKSINHYIKNCNDENSKMACDIGISYLMGVYGEYGISIIDDDNFYVVDNEHIVLGLASSKFTTSLKINTNTYEIVP